MITNLRSTISVSVAEDAKCWIPNNQFFRPDLNEEARAWMIENIGVEANSIAALVTNSGYDFYIFDTMGRKARSHRFTFTFIDRTKAALFKLTWA